MNQIFRVFLVLTIVIFFSRCSMYMKQVVGYHDVVARDYQTILDTTGLNDKHIVFIDVDSTYLVNVLSHAATD